MYFFVSMSSHHSSVSCNRCCLLNFHYMRRTFQTVYMCSKMKKIVLVSFFPPGVFSCLPYKVFFQINAFNSLCFIANCYFYSGAYNVFFSSRVYDLKPITFFLCLLFSCCCATSTEFGAASCSWSAQAATSTAASNGNLHRGASVLLW